MSADLLAANDGDMHFRSQGLWPFEGLLQPFCVCMPITRGKLGLRSHGLTAEVANRPGSTCLRGETLAATNPAFPGLAVACKPRPHRGRGLAQGWAFNLTFQTAGCQVHATSAK